MKKWVKRCLALVICASMLLEGQSITVMASEFDENILESEENEVLEEVSEAEENESVEEFTEEELEVIEPEVDTEIDTEINVEDRDELDALELEAIGTEDITEEETDDDFVIKDGTLVEYKGSDTIVFIPDGVESIGCFCFENSGVERVYLSDSVKNISNEAFINTPLKYIDLCKVETIGTAAFWNTNLKRVVIPKTLKSTGGLWGAPVDKINYPGERYLTEENSINHGEETDYYYYCDSSFDYNLKTVIFEEGITHIPDRLFYKREIEEIVIPDSVTSIGEAAFMNSKVKKVKLPDNLQEIGVYAFRNTTIEEINIPDSVKTIGLGAFEGCKNLKELVLPNNLEKVDVYLFKDSGIEKVNVPNSVRTIEMGAFENSSLEEMVMPDSVEEIKGDAFRNCHNLKKLLFSEGLTTIGVDAFFNCDSLQEVTIPKTVTTMQIRRIRDYSYDSIILHGVFQGCTNLKKMIFEEGIESIPAGAMLYCENITEVDIPDSVGEIGDYAFYGTSISDLKISSYVKLVGNFAIFTNNLKKLTVEGKDTDFKELIDLYYGGNYFLLPTGITLYAYKESKLYSYIADYIGYYNFIAFDYEPATDFTFESDNVTLKNGERKQIKITILPEESTDTPTYKSSNDSVVKVSANGYMTGVAPGTAYIRVKVGSIIKKLKVTVVNGYIQVKLDKTKIALEAGEEFQLTATSSPKVPLIWSSNNQKVATVDENGLVRAWSEGTCKITAKPKEGNGSATCEVNVSNSIHRVTDIADFQSKHDYENNTNERWQYEIPDAKRIAITFSEDTEVEEDFDKIYITDGKNKQIGVFTGTELAGKTITLDGNEVRVKLESDEEGTAYGFRVVRVVDPDAKPVCKSLDEITIEDIPDKEYTGGQIKVEPIVKDGEFLLENGTHYTLSFASNRDIGTGCVTITGNPDYGYKGSRQVSFNIKRFNITNNVGKRLTVTVDKTVEFNKAGAKAKVVMKFKNADGTSNTLVEGIDYTLSYDNHTTYTSEEKPMVTIVGKGRYSGKRKVKYNLTVRNINKAKMTANDAVYVALPNYYSTSVTIKDSGETLKYGVDYENLKYTYTAKTVVTVSGKKVTKKAGDVVSAKDVIPVDTVLKVTATAKSGSGYRGTISTTYTIKPLSSFIPKIIGS